MKKFIYNKKAMVTLAFLAGLFYNAWLLGFWLNPTVVKSQLLSSLGALDQPYHEIFIATDIVSGLLILILAFCLWKRPTTDSFLVKWSRILLPVALIGFALTTILAAIFAQPQAGKTDLSNPLEFAHDMLSVLALGCMMIAILLGLVLFRNGFFCLLAALYFISLVFSSYEGLFPHTVGPTGQWFNSLLVGLWLVITTWKLLKAHEQS